MSDAALAFAGWPQFEAQKRIATLLRCGWSARELAAMFGTTVAEIDRLTGDVDQPVSARPRTIEEMAI
jgi:Trp operon repressor